MVFLFPNWQIHEHDHLQVKNWSWLMMVTVSMTDWFMILIMMEFSDGVCVLWLTNSWSWSWWCSLIWWSLCHWLTVLWSWSWWCSLEVSVSMSDWFMIMIMMVFFGGLCVTDWAWSPGPGLCSWGPSLNIPHSSRMEPSQIMTNGENLILVFSWGSHGEHRS